ncbi:MAG: MBL fold metallo-hydrolase [candidate division WOR-3 bacterium]|nr:MAG: MBL fold metallo-hydrolase [candidate division WOR-3 bacterium]
MKYLIILSVPSLVLFNFAMAQHPGLGNPIVHKISEDVYAVTNLDHSFKYGWTNAGIIFTENSVIFIDCGMTEASAEFLWEPARKNLQGNEKIYLILTHEHCDHIFGMNVFKKKGATVIAHELMIEFLKEWSDKYKSTMIKKLKWSQQKGDKIFGEVKLSLPDRVISQDTVLTINGETISLLSTPGHSKTQLTVYEPKTKTLFASDVIYQGGNPNTSFGGTQEWKAWIRALQRLKSMEIEIICPGHGNLCGKDEIYRNIGYLQGFIKGFQSRGEYK